MSPLRSQRGLAAAAIVILLILLAIALVLGRGFSRPGADLSRRDVTDASMTRASKAMVEFAALNRRLPCPAAGTSDAGMEDDSTGIVTCNSADGVVPWRTLAMRREDALDGWGRKISYRVFSGAAGLTQGDGVNMTNCNTSLGAPINPALAAGSLCASGVPPPNTPAQFLGARGNMLVVQDMATTRNGNAFVLISHGESGYGAYLTEGAATRTMLPNSSGSEYPNTQASGPFIILARSSPETPVTDAGHFDDVVTYMSISDLAANAKLAARSWSNFPLTATFSESAVNAALGFALGGSEDTERTSLSLGGFLITATASGATRNVGFEQSGLGGLGVVGGSSTSGDLNSAFGETLTFQLGAGSEFGKMDVALNAFEITDTSPLRKEGAEISFWRSGTLTQTSTINAWDRAGDPSRCRLRLPTGGVFDRMDLKAVDQTNGGGSSRFQVAGIKACTDSTTPCATAIAGAVACPIPPPSAKCDASSSAGKTTATLLGTVEDNGVSMGTGTGYRVSSSSYAVGETSISMTTGTGTIAAGNCLTIAGDSNTYVVATGISSAPGTLLLADPGLLRSIGFFVRPAVTLTSCQTTVSFDFGTTSAYGSSVAATPPTIDAGAGSTCVTASVTGLTCGSPYFYRTRATSPGGTTLGNDCQFTTAACSAALPSAQSQNPTSIGRTSATLNGFANDNGKFTDVSFEYGLTPCYGSSVNAVPANIGVGVGNTAVTANLTGLTCNTYYHYRVKAVSIEGASTGNDTLLLTAPCS